jgi:hypothetical protein
MFTNRPEDWGLRRIKRRAAAGLAVAGSRDEPRSAHTRGLACLKVTQCGMTKTSIPVELAGYVGM